MSFTVQLCFLVEPYFLHTFLFPSICSFFAIFFLFWLVFGFLFLTKYFPIFHSSSLSAVCFDLFEITFVHGNLVINSMKCQCILWINLKMVMKVNENRHQFSKKWNGSKKAEKSVYLSSISDSVKRLAQNISWNILIFSVHPNSPVSFRFGDFVFCWYFCM